jgi:D-amino-acid oxidase
MQAVRGQVVRVQAPQVERVLLAEDAPGGPIYVIPRRDDCVVGGTAEPLAPGAEDDVTTCEPSPATSAAILAKAMALLPALAGAPMLGARVGLRPARPAVRLERATLASGVPVVHCYGHGGSGYTLAWGCADEVLGLVERG